MSSKRPCERVRCGFCGQWAKADRLVDFVLVCCSGLACQSHALGVIGKGQTDRQAFEDFLDEVENAKNN